MREYNKKLTRPPAFSSARYTWVVNPDLALKRSDRN